MATLEDYLQPRARRVQWKDPITGKWVFFQELSAKDWVQLQADVGEDEQFLTDFREDYLAVIQNLQKDVNIKITDQQADFIKCYNEKSKKVSICRIAALSSIPRLKTANAAVLITGLTPEQTRDLNEKLTPLIIFSLEANRIKNSPTSPAP